MATTALTPPTPSEVLPLWLNELREADRATGTIRRYKSAVEGFLAWYERGEQRSLTFATLTPSLWLAIAMSCNGRRGERRVRSTVT